MAGRPVGFRAIFLDKPHVASISAIVVSNLTIISKRFGTASASLGILLSPSFSFDEAKALDNGLQDESHGDVLPSI
jgi:hypothetical protein